MRTLKLQMQMSTDGYCGGLKGELDWMTWIWDDELKAHVSKLTDTIDTILLGRKMADGFISHWSKAATNARKVVFSKTLTASDPMVASWKNTELVSGDLVAEVNQLKNESGMDIIVYGGSNFVSNLIKNNLIDEYNLFVNPTAIGNEKGLPVFTERTKLALVTAQPFACGVALLQYKPVAK